MDKADFIGTWTIDTAAKREAVLAAANNRGQVGFDACAAYGGTTTTTPLTMAEMLQTYTLDAAAVEVVLTDVAIRGHEFLTAMATEGATGGQQARIISSGNEHLFGGEWKGGERISILLKIIDPDGRDEVDSWVILIPDPPPNVTWDPAVVAKLVCAEIDALVHIRCVRIENKLRLTAAAPANTLESTLTVL